MKNYHQIEHKLQRVLKDAVESGEEKGMQLSVREHGLEILGFIKVCQSPTHPIHPVRDRISSILGLPARHW